MHLDSYSVGLLVLGLELGLGFLWFRSCAIIGGKNLVQVAMVAALVHTLATWLPLVVGLMDYASCERGLPWNVHFAYCAILALASPGLGGLSVAPDDPNPQNGRDDVLAIQEGPFGVFKGTLIATIYTYFITMSNAFDQYGDLMVWAVAKACQWSLAWLILIIYVVGVLVQAAAAGYIAGDWLAIFFSLCGRNPEAKSANLSEEQSSRNQRFGVAMGATRLLTENVPQAYLALRFAKEVKPSATVYASVGLSLVLGAKNFFGAAKYLLSGATSAPAE
jgi:hypothetical protein